MSAPQPQPPSFLDMVAALKALDKAPPEERGIAKHASTIIVAIILALCLWVGAMIMQLSNTTTTVATKLESLGKTIDDMSARQAAASDRLAAVQAAQAKGDQRISAVEMEQQRMRERLRAVEGQAPLPSNEGARAFE